MFKFAICNELWGKQPIENVFRTAADMGYDGVEIAAFTLADSVDEIDADRRRQILWIANDRDNAISLCDLGHRVGMPDRSARRLGPKHISARGRGNLFKCGRRRKQARANDHAESDQSCAGAQHYSVTSIFWKTHGVIPFPYLCACETR